MKKNLLVQIIFISLFISFLSNSSSAGKNYRPECFIQAHRISENHNGFRSVISSSLITKPIFLCPDEQIDQGMQKRAIYELDKLLTFMLSSPDPATVSKGERLQRLVKDLNATIYMNDSQQRNPSQELPVSIETDANSVWMLYENNPEFNNVELITLRISQVSELSTIINAESFQSLPNLKYLFILCSFEICSSPGCEGSIISKMVQGDDYEDFMIIYQISIPE
jgi:hypothetical protein